MENKIIFKKGDIFEIVVFVVVALIIASSFLFFTYMFQKTSDAFRTTPLGTSAEGSAGIDVMEGFGTSSLQKIFLFMIGGLILAQMLTAFFIKTHPVFLPIYIIIVAITLFVAVVGSNAYQALNTGELAATYASQTISSGIMENLVRIVLVSSALSLILMFARLGSDSGGGGI